MSEHVPALQPSPEAYVPGRAALIGFPLAAAACILIAGFWPQATGALVAVPAALLLAILLFKSRVEFSLYLLFALVAWFPEFSQTETVWSASEFPSLYNFRPIKQITASVFDYLFLLVVLVWLFKVVLHHPKRLRRPPMVGGMLYAFFGMCLFSLVYGLLRGGQPYHALREFRVSSYFALIFLMAVTSLDRKAVLEAVPRLLLGMATLSSIFGIVRHAMGIGKDYYGHQLIYYDIADSILIVCALLLLVSMALVRWRLLYVPLGAMYLYTIIFSFRRSAWVGLAAGLLAIVVFRPARSFRLWKPAVFAVLLVAVTIPLLNASRMQLLTERLASITDVTGEEDPSNFFRVLDAMNALNAFTEHPILGVGFGGRYQLKFFQEGLAPMEFWDNVSRTSHDGYLFILYKMGATGFLIYLLLQAAFFRAWLRDRRSFTDPATLALFLGMGASFVAIMTTNVASPVTDSLRPSTTLAFVMAAAAVVVRHKQVGAPGVALSQEN